MEQRFFMESQEEEETMCGLTVVNMAATGENICRLRKQAGISVRELQEYFGFGTPQAIYKWQRGEALPTVDNLVLLASILKVRVDDILIREAPGHSAKQE